MFPLKHIHTRIIFVAIFVLFSNSLIGQVTRQPVLVQRVWSGSLIGPIPANATNQGVQMISVGSVNSDSSSCITKRGRVVVWGNASLSAVPINQTNDALDATRDVDAISMGESHMLAFKKNGNIIAWGSNANGESAVPASLSNNVTAVIAGYRNSIAIKNDGTLEAWGYGFTSDRRVAATTTLSLINRAAENDTKKKVIGCVMTGWDNNTPSNLKDDPITGFVLLADFTIARLGDPMDGISDADLAAKQDVVGIAAGHRCAAAVYKNGLVDAWGWSDYSGFISRARNLKGVSTISVGNGYGLAITAQKKVVAWGNIPAEQATFISTLANITSVAAGWSHCLIASGGVFGEFDTSGSFGNSGGWIGRRIPPSPRLGIYQRTSVALKQNIGKAARSSTQRSQVGGRVAPKSR